MKIIDASQLSHFTGTERYYRISRRHLLTDGTKYLAEEAEYFWMMDAIASHLSEIGTDDWFVQVRMTVNENRATMIYEDGNGKEHARQEIPFTDFPMPTVSLYACWDGGHWVIVLPGEYKAIYAVAHISKINYSVVMSNIKFEWDAKKASANEKKHGISFDEARTVFFDENAKLIDDPDHSDDEERFVLLGLSSSLKIMLVCHCYREEGNVIRINSARKASPHESKQYR